VKLNFLDINKINYKYFSKGEQLELFKQTYLDLLPPEKILFPKFIKPGHSVLDLGCGAGRTTAFIRKVTDKVIGTDISKVMIDTAIAKHPDIDFRVMDASAIDYPDESFDVVVFSYNGICYLHPEEKRNAALREVHRVLRRNGKFIFSSFTRYPPYTVSAIVNIIITSLVMGFRTNYKIHLTRHGITVNYETTPDKEIRLLNEINFELEEMVPMSERVGFFRYRPNISTYYVFNKI
jgi:ubiquinone/menaquinone biosynthesis C-methylase UbiE